MRAGTGLPSVVLTKARTQSRRTQRPLPWVLTFVRMAGKEAWGLSQLPSFVRMTVG